MCAGCYPAPLRRLGGGGERLMLGMPLAEFALVLGGVAGTQSGVVAGAAVAAAAVPFVVTQTISVATVVTPPHEGGGLTAAVDAEGGRGGQCCNGLLNHRACVRPGALRCGC